MPVSILFCEGGPQKPDIRLLNSLLAGTCQVRAAGSKYGFGQVVRAHKEAQPQSTIAGLRDRDFDDDDSIPIERPRCWLIEGDSLQIGWYWERVELENYLIDPQVVQYALRSRAPSLNNYRSVLHGSAESIAEYTAARTALSLCRRRLIPSPNAWGRERGSESHPFPDDRSEAACRQQISAVIRQYAETHIVRECEVLAHFDRLLQACRPGGRRYEHFLTFFSGKDILFGMEPALKDFGFDSAFGFRERILKGIESTQDEVWRWLPEWATLRQLVISFASCG